MKKKVFSIAENITVKVRTSVGVVLVDGKVKYTEENVDDEIWEYWRAVINGMEIDITSPADEIKSFFMEYHVQEGRYHAESMHIHTIEVGNEEIRFAGEWESPTGSRLFRSKAYKMQRDSRDVYCMTDNNTLYF
jgi:hypothetical protein